MTAWARPSPDRRAWSDNVVSVIPTPHDATAATPVAPEVTIASVRRHARHLFLPSVIFVAACGLGSYFGGRAAPDWGTGWLGLAIFGAGVVVCGWAWLSWLARRYVVTTRRLIVQRGIVVRRRQEMSHTRGYGCEVVQSPVQRLFGSGDVCVNVGLDHPVIVMDVPHARVFSRALQELQEASESWAIANRRPNTANPGTFTEL